MLREVRWNILIRVVLITLLSIALAFVILNRGWIFTPLVIGILIVMVAWNLVAYLERTNQDITQFILTIKHGGLNTNFPDTKRGRTFRRLSEALNDVITEFHKMDFAREAQHQYLDVLTNSIPLGVITYDETGEVRVCNPFAKNLLQLVRLKEIGELDRVSKKLFTAVSMAKPGERKLLRVVIGENEKLLAIQKKEILVGEAVSNIVLLQDLKAELEDKEVDAWQKLIRVLTHEIMNSVTPIVSLTEAINQLIVEPNGARKDLAALDADDRDDLFGSLATIESRSKGLLQFVNAYKDYTKMPELNLAKMNLAELAERALDLMKATPSFARIDCRITVPKNKVHVVADAHWLEQVLINLLKNAAEAMGNSPGKIEVRMVDRPSPAVMIIDNGPGIEPDSLDKVFIPFYTTKKNGTGIGLSLCRQIMKQQGGNLELTSELGKGTTVVVRFAP